MKSLRSRNLRGVCQFLLVSLLAFGLTATASAQIEITEIMYNPIDFNEIVWEWIEVRNTGGSDVDLDGYLGFNLGDSCCGLDTPEPTISSALSTDTVVPAGRVAVIYDAFSLEFPAQNYDANLFRQAWGIDPNTPVIAADHWPGLSNTNGSQGQSIGFWANNTDYQMDLVTGIDPNGQPDPNNPMVGSFANTQFSIDFSSGFPNSGDGKSLAWSGNGNYQNGSQWVISADGDSTGATTSVQVDVPGVLNSTDDLANPGLLPSGTAATGLHITEILYNPAAPQPERLWEWIEIFNNTGANIDFNSTNYIVDDNNGTAAGVNITSGTLDDGEVGILFNADEVDPNQFAAAWGAGLNLIPVTNWSALALNNGDAGDEIAIWDDPNAYAGDQATHANAIVTQEYGLDNGFPVAAQGQSIYLGLLGLDPNNGGNWVGAGLGDGLSFNAMAVSDPNGNVPYHPGGDQASPGSFSSFAIIDADFDNDGDVDGRDFLLWQQNSGTVGDDFVVGDANGDGDVNSVDLGIWLAQYGNESLSAASGAVPEPSTVLLLSTVLMPLGLRRRRIRR